MGSPANAAARMKARFEREQWLLQVSLAAAMIASAVLVGWLFSIWGPGAPPILLVVAVAIFAAVFVIGRSLVQAATRHGNTILDAVAARMTDGVVPPGGAAWVFVFENGLTAQLDLRPGVAIFREFVAADGSPLKPTAAEALRWTLQVRGVKRLLRVTSREGDSNVRAELKRLQIVFEGESARFEIFDRSARIEQDRTSPKWDARVTILSRRLRFHGEALASEIDRILVFVRDSRLRLAADPGDPINAKRAPPRRLEAE
ncbi:MAG: hypothetical protein L3J78_00105 [Thermoplasmata archaeon]|nr:hypothetical protein [Thermoplasmata archaeon]